jgi:monoamine oxidase
LDWTIASLLTGGSTPAKTGLLNYLSTIHSGDSDYNRIDSIKNSGQETRFVGGAQLLSIKMAQALGDKVRLSCPVRKISGWNQAIVSLHTDQGTLRARRVIMAIHPSLCNQIEFFPALPQSRAALQRTWPAYAPLRKTAMVYSRPFWRDMGLNGHVLQLGGPILWAYDNSPPRGEIGVINAFVASGDLPSDPEAAKRISAELYAKALGPKALKYLSFHDHDWGHADPWAVTCLPAVPPGYWSTHGEALRTPCGNLIWSGTETSEIWVGYMDGAVRSGHTAVRQVVGALQRS